MHNYKKSDCWKDLNSHVYEVRAGDAMVCCELSKEMPYALEMNYLKKCPTH